MADQLNTNIYGQIQHHLHGREILIYLLIGLITWYLYKLCLKPLLSPLRKVPGCPFIPVVGNMLEARNNEAMTNCLRWMKKYDSKIIRFYYFGGQERILVGDPDIFNQVLVKKSRLYKRMNPSSSLWRRMFQDYPPLFRLSGEEHHIVRKVCNPAFSLKNLNGMVKVFENRAEALIQMYDSQIRTGGKSSVVAGIQTDLAKLTLDVICQCGFGYKLCAIENPDNSEVTRLKRITRSAGVSFSNSLFPFAEKLPTKKNKQNLEDVQYLLDLAKQVLQKKRQELENDELSQNDLLTSLLRARDEEGSGISDEGLFSQLVGFMFAGFETTSIAMTWTLLQLAQHKDVQDKVREEVTAVLDQSNGEITHEVLDKMKYLTCVIKETLRLFPPVACVFKQALKDDNFKGYHIPAGTVVGLHIGSLHRLNWKDGDKFQPDRFLSCSENRNLLPFSFGPYMCIGNRFSLMEMKTVVSLLIRRFNFSMVPGYTYRRVQSLVVQPSPSAVLTVTPTVTT